MEEPCATPSTHRARSPAGVSRREQAVGGPVESPLWGWPRGVFRDALPVNKPCPILESGREVVEDLCLMENGSHFRGVRPSFPGSSHAALGPGSRVGLLSAGSAGELPEWVTRRLLDMGRDSGGQSARSFDWNPCQSPPGRLDQRLARTGEGAVRPSVLSLDQGRHAGAVLGTVGKPVPVTRLPRAPSKCPAVWGWPSLCKTSKSSRIL